MTALADEQPVTRGRRMSARSDKAYGRRPGDRWRRLFGTPCGAGIPLLCC